MCFYLTTRTSTKIETVISGDSTISFGSIPQLKQKSDSPCKNLHCNRCSVNWEPLKKQLRAQKELQTIYGETHFFKLVMNSCSTFCSLKAAVGCALQNWERQAQPQKGQWLWIPASWGSTPGWAWESHSLWQPGRFLYSPVIPIQQMACQISTTKPSSKTVFKFITSSDQRWSQEPVTCCTW